MWEIDIKFIMREYICVETGTILSKTNLCLVLPELCIYTATSKRENAASEWVCVVLAMVSQAFRGLWGIMPVRMVSSVKNYSSFSSMTFLLIYFPKDTVSYLWCHSINACRMELNASQGERAKRALSPAEILPLSLENSFLLLWCLIVHCTNKVCPFSSCQPRNLPQFSHLLPDTVNQHTSPTPDGSLLLPLLGKNLQTFLCVQINTWMGTSKGWGSVWTLEET